MPKLSKRSKTVKKSHKTANKPRKTDKKPRKTAKKSRKTKSHKTVKKSKFDKYLESLEIELNGGGYSIDVGAEQIAGQAPVVSYNDCAPPSVLNHELVQSGCGSRCGTTLSGGSNKSKRRTNKKSKRTNKKSKRTNKKQKGGMGVYPLEGEKGNFSADMKTREFGCKQPNWGVNCI